MVWLKKESLGQGVIMIDGYAPSIEHLKNSGKIEDLIQLYLDRHKKDDELALKEYNYYWPNHQHYVKKTLPKYLSHKDLSEKEELRIFHNLAQITRRISCPFPEFYFSIYSYRYPYYCWFFTYTTRENDNSLERTYYKKRYGKVWKDLIREYRWDDDRGLKRYTQNFIRYLNYPQQYSCRRAEECCRNWIELLDFKVKKESQYKNYKAFRNAWETFLIKTLTGKF